MAYADTRLLDGLKRAFLHHWHLDMAESVRDVEFWPDDGPIFHASSLTCALADALAVGKADGMFHEHALDAVEARMEIVLVDCGLMSPNPMEET